MKRPNAAGMIDSLKVTSHECLENNAELIL